MVPGLGLSPYIYRTTPDGRRGLDGVLRRSWPSSVCIQSPRNVDSGGLDTGALQNSDSASLSRWSIDRAWPTWGFGPEVGDPYEDVRYPVESVDQLVASFPAYVSTSGGGGGSRFASPQGDCRSRGTLQSYRSVSVARPFSRWWIGFAVAQTVPDLVERIVAVEPVGAPTDPPTVAEMGGDAPFMGVYGDYVDEREQTGRKGGDPDNCRARGERQVPHRRAA